MEDFRHSAAEAAEAILESVIYIAACFDPRIFPMVIVEYLIR